MDVINFYEAKKKIQCKHQKECDVQTTFKLRFLSNSELFNEYKAYRSTLEHTGLDAGEKIDTDSLIYLCEVALEVAARGLLEDFDKRFIFVTGIIE